MEPRAWGAPSILDVLTPLAATSALTCLTIALATPSWLHTEELIRNRNRTLRFGPASQPEFLAKRTSSGLWQLCYSRPGEEDLSCDRINYFPLEPYRPDPQDSTAAIPYTAVRSCLYFLSCAAILVGGSYCCLAGHLTSRGKLFTFISGVCFILGGLIILMGLIVYISTFKAEVGPKLRSRSELDPPKFKYKYGYSFHILIASFLFSEVAGICSIFQFIYHHQQKWEASEGALGRQEKHPQLSGTQQCQVFIFPPPLLRKACQDC